MHYYEHHIGDYAAATAHLSLIEDAIYCRMLRRYYLTESPLPVEIDEVARLVGVPRDSAGQDTVRAILVEFFTLADDGWHQKRCDENIAIFHGKQAEADTAREHEAERKRLYRERRSELFQQLRALGIVPSFDTTTTELVRLLSLGTGQGQDADGTANQSQSQSQSVKKKSAKARTPSIGLQAFLAECEEAGEEAIPVDDAVFAYAQRIGLPSEYVAMAWAWFKVRYADKKQAGVRGWRQTFRNAVEGNWPKYWYAENAGGWGLTTAGKQARAAQ